MAGWGLIIPRKRRATSRRPGPPTRTYVEVVPMLTMSIVLDGSVSDVDVLFRDCLDQMRGVRWNVEGDTFTVSATQGRPVEMTITLQSRKTSPPYATKVIIIDPGRPAFARLWDDLCFRLTQEWPGAADAIEEAALTIYAEPGRGEDRPAGLLPRHWGLEEMVAPVPKPRASAKESRQELKDRNDALAWEVLKPLHESHLHTHESMARKMRDEHPSLKCNTRARVSEVIRAGLRGEFDPID